MQSTKGDILRAIKAGDVIFALAAGGQDKLLLVYKTTPKTIYARHVTTGTKVEFDRDGRSRRVEGGGSGTIFSAAPLPVDQYNIVIGLERKMRMAVELADLRLSEDEIQMLLTHEAFFRAHPLPEV